MISFLTDFADQAVLLPVAATVAIALLLSDWRRGALAWTLVTIAVLGIMLVLKLASFACGPMLVGRELHSPSGHVAAAASIYGGLIALAVRRSSERVRWWLLAGVGVALAVGATRLALGVHTVLEAVVGSIVGVGGALAAARFAGRPPARLRFARVAAAVIVVALTFHGFHLPAEAAIRHSPLLHLWPLSACTDHHSRGALGRFLGTWTD